VLAEVESESARAPRRITAGVKDIEPFSNQGRQGRQCRQGRQWTRHGC
jgi:hypothetical protein